MRQEMEQNNHPITALAYTMASIVSAFFANVNWGAMQPAISFIASIIACGSGLMAIRYYYYSTKSKK